MYQILGYFIGLLYTVSVGTIYVIYLRAREDKVDAHGDSWSQRFWVSSKKPFLETSDSVFTWITLKVRIGFIILTCIPSFFIKSGTVIGDSAIWLSNLVYYYDFLLLFIFSIAFLRLFFPFLLFFLPKIKYNRQEMITTLLFAILSFGFQILLVALKNPLAIHIADRFLQFVR